MGGMDRPPVRKTAGQKLVEREYGRPLEEPLPELVRKHGSVKPIVAELKERGLDASVPTLHHWLVQFRPPTIHMEAREKAWRRRTSAA